jgi:hypothetical protein
VRILILLILLVCFPGFVSAAGTDTERPHWSFELKGGAFFPGASNWSKYYGKDFTGEYGGAVAYKLLRQLELGVEASYINTTGKASAPLNNTLTGEVNNQLVPLGVYLLGRGLFYEKQLLVPYAGGGYTRTLYWQEVKNQGKVKGSVNGYYGRAGLQVLLDNIDPESSKNLKTEFNVKHTYLFAEGKYSHASAPTIPSGTVNIGGTSWLGGFLFEF